MTVFVSILTNAPPILLMAGLRARLSFGPFRLFWRIKPPVGMVCAGIGLISLLGGAPLVFWVSGQIVPSHRCEDALITALAA